MSDENLCLPLYGISISWQIHAGRNPLYFLFQKHLALSMLGWRLRRLNSLHPGQWVLMPLALSRDLLLPRPLLPLSRDLLRLDL